MSRLALGWAMGTEHAWGLRKEGQRSGGGQPGLASVQVAPRGILGGSQVELAQLSGTETERRTRGGGESVGWGQPVQRSWVADRELAPGLLAHVPSWIWYYRDLPSYSFNKDLLNSLSATCGSITHCQPPRQHWSAGPWLHVGPVAWPFPPGAFP